MIFQTYFFQAVRHGCWVALACGWMGCLLFGLHANVADAAIARLQRVENSLGTPVAFNQPLFATSAPGDRDRLFVVERGGSIQILDIASGTKLGQSFLDIPDTLTSGEGGLLGLAFHPDYETNGKFYVQLTAANSVNGSPFSSYVREYTVSANPNVANTTFNPIISWTQPQANHNAGWIGFSPNDNFLYVTSGDGGGGNDSGAGHTPGIGNAQDITDNLLGKMLRLDVNGDDFPADTNRNYAIPNSNPFVGVTGDDEIWAYGLRNPFRSSFDRVTGDLWMGDVGQVRREEINFQPGNSTGGENYGWRLREGLIPTPSVGGPKPADNVDPVYDYRRPGQGGPTDLQGRGVTGGYVYRGPDPELQGTYIFADFTVNRFWTFDPSDPFGTVQNINGSLGPDIGFVGAPVSFGEDAVGNLYVTDITGQLFRLETDALISGDFDADGDADGDDLSRWELALGIDDGADADGDGDTDGADFLAWQRNFGSTAQDGAALAASQSGNVPEPGGLLLAMCAAMTICVTRVRGVTRVRPSSTTSSRTGSP